MATSARRRARSHSDLDGAVESTGVLVLRAQKGDTRALEALTQRYLWRLRRWATGRLPKEAREATDTEDLVQETLMASLQHLPRLSAADDGAWFAYLRQALMNRIRDRIRRSSRRPEREEVGEIIFEGPSPLEEAVGRERVARYSRALSKLRPHDQTAVVGRIEMGLTYEELADVLGKATPDAARVAAARAIARLANYMRDDAR
jgi:RNA polymerase sigma-70 factor (ECF subfamily)